jgi:hypothetical protein
MDRQQYMNAVFKILLDNVKGYRYVRTFGLDTTVYHSGSGFDDYVAALSFEVNGTPVVWVNPIVNDKVNRAQQLFIPTNDEDGKEALRLGRCTMSLLSYASRGIGIKTRIDLFSPVPGVAQSGHKYEGMGLTGYDFATLMLATDFTAMDKSTWIGLAYYRLALNADSEYYQYLSWWQIIELFHGNKEADVKKWVNSQVPTDPMHADWLSKPGTRYRDAYGRLHDTRAKCAHIANSDNPKRMVIDDPDDPDSIKQVIDDIPVVRGLAEKFLKSRPGIDRL